jgi:hypothetical protein
VSVTYFDLATPAPSGTPTVAPTTVLDVPVADVAHAQVVDAGKTAAVSRRDESTWEIVAPSTEPADNRRVEDAVGRIAKLNATRKLDDPGDLSVFGLVQPPIELELRLRDGSTRKLLVGAKTPDNSSYYVKTPEAGTVYVVSSFAVSEMTRWVTDPPRPRPTPTAMPPATPKPAG